MAKSLANELVGTGFTSQYWLQVFKDPVGRCKSITPSSLSLTTNKLRKPTNSPTQRVEVCDQNSMLEPYGD